VISWLRRRSIGWFIGVWTALVLAALLFVLIEIFREPGPDVLNLNDALAMFAILAALGLWLIGCVVIALLTWIVNRMRSEQEIRRAEPRQS
jgi:hypothetical protein